MDFLIHIREAFTNLVMAKLRSFLAILGVLVGTGSVVALIASSQLATSHALSQFKTLGTNLLALSLQAKTQTSSQTQEEQLRLENMSALVASAKQVVGAAPYINAFQPVYIDGKNVNSQIIGATGELAKIAKIEVSKGRFVSALDKQSFYCVIGDKLAKHYSDRFVDPIGQQIKVGTHYFTVIGVAKKWQPNLFLFVNIDQGVIIPLEATYLLQKGVQISNVLFRLVPDPDLDEAKRELTQKLLQLLPKMKAQFRSPAQIINIVGKQRKTFTWLLGAIGGIALLVGGIGVMNIMLVSVVERRREIGIRMAIGARQSDILSMFLIESIILTVFGGLLGIILGVGVSYLLSVLTGWEFIFYILPPTLGFVVSVFVGMLSGFYPALRASKLNPIECLQTD